MGKSRKLKGKRVYPEVGPVDTMHDVHELIRAIESDNIPEGKKRERLQFMYSLTFSENFKNQFKGNIGKARRAFKVAYERHKRRENLKTTLRIGQESLAKRKGL